MQTVVESYFSNRASYVVYRYIGYSNIGLTLFMLGSRDHQSILWYPHSALDGTVENLKISKS